MSKILLQFWQSYPQKNLTNLSTPKVLVTSKDHPTPKLWQPLTDVSLNPQRNSSQFSSSSKTQVFDSRQTWQSLRPRLRMMRASLYSSRDCQGYWA